jgi:hypothetical protein
MDQLIPDNELKQKIEEWVRERLEKYKSGSSE